MSTLSIIDGYLTDRSGSSALTTAPATTARPMKSSSTAQGYGSPAITNPGPQPVPVHDNLPSNSIFPSDVRIDPSPPDLDEDHDFIRPPDLLSGHASSVVARASLLDGPSDEELHAHVANSLAGSRKGSTTGIDSSSEDGRRMLPAFNQLSIPSAHSSISLPASAPRVSTSQSTPLINQPSKDSQQSKPIYRMTFVTRLVYSCLLLLPLLAAVGIMAATCAPFQWYRARLSISRMTIPANQWNNDETVASGLGMNRGGAITLGLWGWCFEANGQAQVACSDNGLWYDMRGFFKEAGATTSSLRPNAFSINLIRALITHIIAAGLAVVALLLVIWHVYRRYVANDNRVDATWLQHGSCFVAFLAGLAAYIVDLTCRKSLKNHAPKLFKVEQGSVPFFTLIGFLILLLSFFCSSLPVLFEHLRRQQVYGTYTQSSPILRTHGYGFADSGLDDDEDYESPTVTRRRSIWQRGVSRVRHQSMARIRSQHRGTSRDGATKLIERYGEHQPYLANDENAVEKRYRDYDRGRHPHDNSRNMY